MKSSHGHHCARPLDPHTHIPSSLRNQAHHVYVRVQAAKMHHEVRQTVTSDAYCYVRTQGLSAASPRTVTRCQTSFMLVSCLLVSSRHRTPLHTNEQGQARACALVHPAAKPLPERSGIRAHAVLPYMSSHVRMYDKQVLSSCRYTGGRGSGASWAGEERLHMAQATREFRRCGLTHMLHKARGRKMRGVVRRRGSQAHGGCTYMARWPTPHEGPFRTEHRLVDRGRLNANTSRPGCTSQGPSPEHKQAFSMREGSPGAPGTVLMWSTLVRKIPYTRTAGAHSPAL